MKPVELLIYVAVTVAAIMTVAVGTALFCLVVGVTYTVSSEVYLEAQRESRREAYKRQLLEREPWRKLLPEDVRYEPGM